METKTDLKAYASVLGAVIFWGISFVATKAALQSLSPYMLLASRFAVASIILFPVWWAWGRERLRSEDLVLFILLGLMEPGLYFLFETWGLVYTTASMASLIIASMPVFVALMAAVFLKEPLTPRLGLGISMTLIGVTGLIWQGLKGVDAAPNALLGNTLVLGAAFCASAYTIVSRQLRARYRALTLTLIQFLFATLFFLPFAGMDWVGGKTPQFTAEAATAVLFLAICATLLAFFLYNYGLGALEASRVAVFINLIPLVTVMAAWAYLGEKLSGLQALGGVFILLGVSLTTTGHLRKRASQPLSELTKGALPSLRRKTT